MFNLAFCFLFICLSGYSLMKNRIDYVLWYGLISLANLILGLYILISEKLTTIETLVEQLGV